MSTGSFDNILVNGRSIKVPEYEKYISSDGCFRRGSVRINPSGSVRIGDVKIHPSGRIECSGIIIERSILPVKATAPKPTTTSKAPNTNTQSTSRSVLSETTTNKVNATSKDTTSSKKVGAVTFDDTVQSENRVESAGVKRKSTEAAPGSAKKQRTITDALSGNSVAPTSVTTKPCPPLSIHEIELDGQWSDEVAVYDSCDQIRSKIHAHLAQAGATKAQFCRDMQAQMYSATAPSKFQSKMVDDFLRKSGASHGCTSSVYYAAYVFFEKWRLVKDEAKSRHRKEMEKIWPAGMERDRDATSRGVWCLNGEKPRQDSYGRWKIR